VAFLPLVAVVLEVEADVQRHTAAVGISTSEVAMTRTPRSTRHWLRRPHRHAWLADTRNTDYSTARLMIGYGNHQS
jgi:hypothetical protein